MKSKLNIQFPPPTKAEISRVMKSMSLKAQGVKKTFSAYERAARAERMKRFNALRAKTKLSRREPINGGKQQP